MEVQQWRCIYCEHEVKGVFKPVLCPFCNFSRDFLVDPATFCSIKNKMGILTEQDILDLETTLELEKLNVEFYSEAENLADGDNVAFLAYFRHIRRNEEYHLDMTADYLEINLEETDITDDSLELPSSYEDIFMKGKEIETEAVQFYKSAAQRTNNDYLKWVYEGLISAEQQHIETFDTLLKAEHLYILGE